MERLIARWQHTNYMEPLLCFILCTTFIVALANQKKHRTLRHIPLYITAFLLAILATLLPYFILNKYYKELLLCISNYLDYFFTLVEILIFSHFFYQIINNHLVKRLI